MLVETRTRADSWVSRMDLTPKADMGCKFSQELAMVTSA